MEEIPETYFVEVECGNCGWKGSVEIPKGTAVEDFPCPSCGVVDLSKVPPMASSKTS